MASQGQKLLLQAPVPIGQGDVADDDDGVRRAPLLERLPGRDEPAARVLAREAGRPGRQAERQAERLAPRGAGLRRLVGGQRPSPRIVRRHDGLAKEVDVGGVPAQGRPRLVHHQHGILETGQDDRELCPLGLQHSGQSLHPHAMRLQRPVRALHLRDGGLQIGIAAIYRVVGGLQRDVAGADVRGVGVGMCRLGLRVGPVVAQARVGGGQGLVGGGQGLIGGGQGLIGPAQCAIGAGHLAHLRRQPRKLRGYVLQRADARPLRRGDVTRHERHRRLRGRGVPRARLAGDRERAVRAPGHADAHDLCGGGGRCVPGGATA
jgi:hypothetical protein